MSNPISEHCYYCESENVDHRHGGGASCGDCCGMHGMLTAPEYKHGEYQWVAKCIKAKNERIAVQDAELREAKQDNADLRATVEHMGRPVSDEEWRSRPRGGCETYDRYQVNALIASRARSTP